MTVKYNKNCTEKYSNNTGYEGSNIPNDFYVPSNTIDDVDRSIFELFDKSLPFHYELSGTSKRVPVIFASGERFAVLRRRQPLRDNAGTLILPLISIARTSIIQSNSHGDGRSESHELVIKKRLSKEDSIYQNLLNKKNNTIKANNNYNEKLTNNIFEIFTLPAAKYFTATYEITFWTQYTKQMNDMLTALMSLYQSNQQKTLFLKTKKGYWFVGYVGDSLNNGDNFDNFNDDERLVRYSFEVQIPSYIVAPEFPGSISPIRRFVSSPDIVFDVIIDDFDERFMGIPSHNINDHILEDLRTECDPIVGQNIGTNEIFATHDSRGIFKKGNQAFIKNNENCKKVLSNSSGETVYKNLKFN